LNLKSIEQHFDEHNRKALNSNIDY